jgi:hypothetical protein
VTLTKTQALWLKLLNGATSTSNLHVPAATKVALLRKGLVVPTVFGHVKLTDAGNAEATRRAEKSKGGA